MAAHRKSSPQFLHGDLNPVLDGVAYCINETGIYVGSRGKVTQYSHEFKRMAQYLYSDKDRPKDVCIHPIAGKQQTRITVTTATNIFVSQLSTGIQHMNCRLSDEEGTINNIVYHPIRHSYLMPEPYGILEICANFSDVDSIFRGGERPRLILPSEQSTLIYSITDTKQTVRLNVIDNPSFASLCIALPYSSHTLAMRPSHPEILTSFGYYSISLFDAFHASASGLTTYDFAHPICRSACGVCIDPNVCATSHGWHLHIVDYRCGLAQTLKLKTTISDIWYAHGRIYAEDNLDDRLCTID